MSEPEPKDSVVYKPKKATGDVIASIIILLISIAGFAGGLLQSSYSTDASDEMESVDELREIADEMQTKIEYYIQQEHSLQEEVYELYDEIFEIINAWFPVLDPFNNISEETIKLTNITSVVNIQSKLWKASQKLNESNVHHLYMYFEVFNETEPFRVPLSNDREFNITKENWDRHYRRQLDPEFEFEFEEANQTLYKIANSTDYLLNNILWQEFPKDMLAKIQVNMPKSFFLVDLGLFSDLLYEPYYIIMGESFDMEMHARYLEDKGDLMSLGVAIITVAMVLSTTMANRLNEKKVYDRINLVRADLMKNPELGVSRGDKFAIPVLITALIVSAIGLLLSFDFFNFIFEFI